MKKSILLGALLIAVTTTTITSCSKYTEGSKFTILTKKARLVNTWKLSKIKVGSTETSSTGVEMDWDIKKDGSYIMSYGTSTDAGKWQFSSDKKQVLFTGTGSSTADIYTIIELKNKEMKLSPSDDLTSVYTLVSK